MQRITIYFVLLMGLCTSCKESKPPVTPELYTPTTTWREVELEKYISNPLVSDAQGNVYMSGTQHEPNEYSPSIENPSSFITKYNRQGIVVWQRILPFVLVKGLCISKNGTVYITGASYGTQGLEDEQYKHWSSASPQKTPSFFVASYTSAGEFRWSKKGYGKENIGGSITVNEQGVVSVAGTFIVNSKEPGFQLDNLVLSQVYYQTLFAVQYTDSGLLKWGRTIDAAFIYAPHLISDKLGNLYMHIILSSPKKPVENIPIASSSDFPTCLLKINATGKTEWVRLPGDRGQSTPSIAVDNENNVYIMGNMYKHAEVGTYTFTTSSNSGCYLVKYTPAGAVSWAKQIGSSKDYVRGERLVVDEQQRIGMSGYFNYGHSSTLTIGKYTLAGEEYGNLYFLAFFTSSGEEVDAKRAVSLNGYDDILPEQPGSGVGIAGSSKSNYWIGKVLFQ